MPSRSASPAARRPSVAAVGSTRRNDELERLRELVDRAERLRTRGLPFDELRELGRLYRLHSARLARLRAHGDDPDAIRALNALLVRAYTCLHGAHAPEPARGIRAERLAHAIARSWPFQLAAWSLLAIGIAMGAGLALRDPAALPVLVPSSLGYSAERLERLVESPEARARMLAREATPTSRNVLFGSALFVHNTRVGLLALATGVLGGVPTVLLQLYNGLTIGALGAVFVASEARWRFLSWIGPHAVPELTAICLCAAAGLQLGAAVAAPGRRRRREALREAADSALLLALASIPFFLAAAAIESFVRESALGTAPRFAVMAAMLAAVLGLLLLTRRMAREHPPDLAWLAALSAPGHGAAPGSGSGAAR